MANISEYISKIRTAIYGKDVRGSLADGLDAVNKETEAATALAQEIDQRQTSIEKQFDDQIANMTLDDPSSAELVAARTNVNTGESYDTIGRRLDAEYADVTAQFDQNLSIIKNIAVQPEMFGAVGDGNVDDTLAVQNAIDYAVTNQKKFLASGWYKINDDLILNNRDVDIAYLDFKITGVLIPTTNVQNLLIIDRIKYSNIRVAVGWGGSETAIGVKITNCEMCDIDIVGQAFNGTVLKIDDGTVKTTNFKLKANAGCGRALIHGNSDISKAGNAFGGYEYIYDFDSRHGSIIQNTTDITIKHYENHFINLSEPSLTIKNVYMMNFDTLAIGGKAPYLLDIQGDYSRVNIDNMFIMNEDTSDNLTNGIHLVGTGIEFFIKKLKVLSDVLQSNFKTLVSTSNRSDNFIKIDNLLCNNVATTGAISFVDKSETIDNGVLTAYSSKFPINKGALINAKSIEITQDLGTFTAGQIKQIEYVTDLANLESTIIANPKGIIDWGFVWSAFYQNDGKIIIRIYNVSNTTLSLNTTWKVTIINGVQ